jgi:UDP-glucose 4-epimerase
MYNVYGPRQALDNPYQGVLGIFLGNVMRREPLTIFGDGHQSRDFIYIRDIVDAWLTALQTPATYGRVFNLGSGQRLSIAELAHQVLATAHRNDTGIVFAPARPGEQRHVEADTNAARVAFGWEPRVPFATGLGETMAWAEAQGVPAETGADPGTS